MTIDDISRLLDKKLENVATRDDVMKLEKRLDGVEGQLVDIKKELDLAVGNIDGLTEMFQDMAQAIVIRKEFVVLEKRMEKVEEHLGLAV